MTYLALALGVAAAILVALPDAAHHAAPHAVAALWALALWAGHRHRAALYHRHRWEREERGEPCHARPTRMHRARLAARRARTLRLRTDTTTRTA